MFILWKTHPEAVEPVVSAKQESVSENGLACEEELPGLEMKN